MNTNVLSDSELPMAFETRCTITCAPYPIAVHSTLLPDLAASSSVVACSTGIPAYTIISPHRQPVDTDFGIGHIYIATSNKFTNAMTHHWIRGRANNATTWARRRLHTSRVERRIMIYRTSTRTSDKFAWPDLSERGWSARSLTRWERGIESTCKDVFAESASR